MHCVLLVIYFRVAENEPREDALPSLALRVAEPVDAAGACGNSLRSDPPEAGKQSTCSFPSASSMLGAGQKGQNKTL
jgi:hypothetical protein